MEREDEDGRAHRPPRAAARAQNAAGGGGGAGNDVIVKRLKTQVRELQGELRAKEALVGELGSSTKNTQLKELDVERKTYFDECRRALIDLQAEAHAREVEETAARHAAAIAAKDETVEAMRAERKKMTAQNVALDDELGRWLEENDALKAAIVEREKKLQMAPLEQKEELGQTQKALREAQADGRQKSRDIAKLKAEHESFLKEMKEQVDRRATRAQFLRNSLRNYSDGPRASTPSAGEAPPRRERRREGALSQARRAIAPLRARACRGDRAAPAQRRRAGGEGQRPRRGIHEAGRLCEVDARQGGAGGDAATGKAAPGKALHRRPQRRGGSAAAAPAAADNQLVAALQSEDGRKELKALFVSLDRNDDEKVDQIEWGRGLAKNQARRNLFGAIPRNYSHRAIRRC